MTMRLAGLRCHIVNDIESPDCYQWQGLFQLIIYSWQSVRKDRVEGFDLVVFEPFAISLIVYLRVLKCIPS
jgi:hypothetical protein